MQLSELLEKLDNVKRSGKGFQCQCPTHADKQSSLHIEPSTDGKKILLKCHAGCSTLTVMETLGLELKDLFCEEGDDWKQEVKSRNKKSSNLPFPDDDDGFEAIIPQKIESLPTNQPVVKAKAKRTPVCTYDYKDEQGTLIFQSVRYEPKGFGQRRPDGNGGWIWKLDEDTRKVLYKLPEVITEIAEGKRIYIVEGEKDVLSLRKLGLCATSNPAGGGNWSSKNGSYGYGAMLTGADIVVLPDNDDTGKKHTQQVTEDCKDFAKSIRVLRLPGLPPKGDVTDWIEAGGTAEKLERMADRCVLFYGARSETYKRGVQHISELLDANIADAKDRGTREGLQGVNTGFDDLNWMTGGLRNSSLNILAGRPGMGKTSLALQMAVSSAMALNPTMFFSLEMSKEQIVTKILSSTARVDFHGFDTGRLLPGDWERVEATAKILKECPLWIDDTTGLTTEDMMTKSVDIKAEHGLGLVVVDYLQIMKPPKSFGRTQEVGAIAQGLKDIALELDIPVLALAQLNRDVDNRTDKRPHLSDLRESGNIEQAADLVMMVYREDYYKKTDDPYAFSKVEILIEKQRMGKTGTVNIGFVPQYVRFEGLDNKEQQIPQEEYESQFAGDPNWDVGDEE